MNGLTRRRVIANGAVSAAVITLPLPLARPAAAAEPPRALRRSTWQALVGERVACATGFELEVVAVADLTHAGERGLAGDADAFAVMLGGRAEAALAGVATELTHPSFGSASLFLGQVDRPDAGRHHFELVIDRSVPLASVPAPLPEAPGEPAVPAPPPQPLTEAERAEVRRYAFVRAARLARRRGRRVVRLRFAPAADIRRVRVRLERAGRVLARGQGTALRHAAELRLQASGPMPRGRCDLVVTAVDGAGLRTTVRLPVVI